MARASTTSDPFNAIAEPRRRHILEFLAAEERSVGDIADALELNQPSVSKHLHVLLDVGLVCAQARRQAHDVSNQRRHLAHGSRLERHVRAVLARPVAAHQGTRGGQEMTTTLSGTDQQAQTFTITEDIHVRRVARDDLRLADHAARAPERNARRQAAADDPRAQARRPVVSRSRRRQRPSLGIRAEHQAAGAARNLGTVVHVDRRHVQPDLPAV